MDRGAGAAQDSGERHGLDAARHAHLLARRSTCTKRSSPRCTAWLRASKVARLADTGVRMPPSATDGVLVLFHRHLAERGGETASWFLVCVLGARGRWSTVEVFLPRPWHYPTRAAAGNAPISILKSSSLDGSRFLGDRHNSFRSSGRLATMTDPSHDEAHRRKDCGCS